MCVGGGDESVCVCFDLPSMTELMPQAATTTIMFGGEEGKEKRRYLKVCA